MEKIEEKEVDETQTKMAVTKSFHLPGGMRTTEYNLEVIAPTLDQAHAGILALKKEFKV